MRNYKAESARLLGLVEECQEKAEACFNPIEKMKLAGEAVEYSVILARLQVEAMNAVMEKVFENGK